MVGFRNRHVCMHCGVSFFNMDDQPVATVLMDVCNKCWRGLQNGKLKAKKEKNWHKPSEWNEATALSTRP